MTWHAAVYVGEILAVGLGWGVVRRRAGHWPVAALFTFGLGSDVVRLLLKHFALYYRTGAVEGWKLFAEHAGQGLFLGWYAAIAAVAVAVFLRRQVWAVLAGWAALCVLLTLGSPLAHHLDHEKYKLVHFVTLGLGIISAGVGIDRSERHLSVTRIAVLLVLLTELAVFLSPWWIGNVFAHWATAQVIYTTAFMSVSLLQAGYLARRWRRVRRGLPLPEPAALESTEDRRSSEP